MQYIRHKMNQYDIDVELPVENAEEHLETYDFDVLDVNDDTIYAESDYFNGSIEVVVNEDESEIRSYDGVSLDDVDVELIERLVSGEDIPVSIEDIAKKNVSDVVDEWYDVFDEGYEDVVPTPACQPD